MGPSPPNEEPAVNWRNQLQSRDRERIVTMIIETLKKQHLPFSGPEGINEHRKIATRFEEKVFSSAANLTGYLREISYEMMSIETMVNNAADDSSISSYAAHNSTPLNSERLTENNNWKHFSEFSLPYREPAMETGDWRTQQPPDSRRNNVNELMETLKKHVPYSGQEGIEELMRIAVSFEELIFNTARNQVDYLRKISLKMQIMEESN